MRSAISLPVRSEPPEPGVVQMLLVCRANQCRSPFAESIARNVVEDRPIRIASAGLLPGGRPMPRKGQEVGRSFGMDFSGHLSREIDPYDCDGFDVILTMARDQSRDLIAENPDLWPRVFTLKQFDRWLAEHPRPQGRSLGEWIDAEGARRPRRDLFGSDPDDDIADPLELPAAAWIEMAWDLSDLLPRVLDRMMPTDERDTV